MPLQLDVATQNISTPSNDTQIYSWSDVVALGSTKLDVYGDSIKPFYRWRGILDVGNATLNIQNIDIELYGVSTDSPGIIRATGNGNIVFGDNTGLKPKNGCNIKITRKFSSNANNFSLYSPLTYCITDNDKFRTTPKIKIYNSRVFFSSLTLMTGYGGRIYIFISEAKDCIFSLEQQDNSNEKRLNINIQPNGVLAGINVKLVGISLLGNTSIEKYTSIDAGAPLDTFAGAYYFAATYFEISDAQFYGNNYFYSRDQSSGYIFLNSPTVDISNGYVFAVEDYYPYAECKKTFSHDLKIVDASGSVPNVFVAYEGRTNTEATTNSSGVVPTFKLVTQETNVQSLVFPGNYTQYSTPLPVVNYASYVRRIKSYLHEPIIENLIIDSQVGNSFLPFQYSLILDVGVTQSNVSIVDTYTGISHTTTTITITQARTLNEIYDSRKLYWRNNPGLNPPYKESNVFNLGGANLVINGVTLTPSAKFNFIKTTGVITFINGGDATVSTEDSIGIRTFISITGLITGSEVKIYNELTNTEFAGVESAVSSTQTFSYIYTPGVTVTIVVFKEDYVPIRLTGMLLTDTPQSVQVQQRFDRVYSNP